MREPLEFLGGFIETPRPLPHLDRKRGGDIVYFISFEIGVA